MKGALQVLRFMLAAVQEGERVVLVTITDVIGSSSRAPGSHMAVRGDGRFVGSFSGGCVEAAVVAEARQVLANGAASLVRFGAGSHYIDIRLPCGGGIDLLFTPDPPLALLRDAVTLLETRAPVALKLGRNGSVTLDEGGVGASCWVDGHSFVARHEPDLRLVIAGHGAETAAMVRLATGFGAQVHVLTPDEELLRQCLLPGVTGDLLLTARSPVDLGLDCHSAFIVLFHDHDWEPQLLARALTSEAFIIGAMGSRTTHAQRCAALESLGLPAAAIARIVGPVGLIPATRDPELLALSILAQIADRQHNRARSSADQDPAFLMS